MGDNDQNQFQLNIAKMEGQRELLTQLMRIAQDTQGAEVWRSLFAEWCRNLGETIRRQTSGRG